MDDSIFHKGEIKVQKMAGEEKLAKRVGRVIQESIMPGAMDFMTKQSFVVVLSIGMDGMVWASVLFGKEGFIQVQGTKTFSIHLDKLQSSSSDIFFKNITHNPTIGTLFIDHGLRIRYRVNGSIQQNGQLLSVHVEEAYGNCPKYIQAAMFSAPNSVLEAPKILEGVHLKAKQLDIITHAHTFYLATTNKKGRMDASHRGGNTGFIQVMDGSMLRIPDYPGNSMFNSLGNIYENPNTGLTFIDYMGGETLQLSGKAELLFDQKDPGLLKHSGNTGRYWLFKPEKWISIENHHSISYKFLDFSPYNY